MLLTVLITAHFCLLIFLFPFSFCLFIFSYFFFSSSAMSISFIMKMGNLDSENCKVLSGPPSTLQLSSQFGRELFTVYSISYASSKNKLYYYYYYY